MIYKKIIIPFFGGISKDQNERLIKDEHSQTHQGIIPRQPGTLLSRQYHVKQPTGGLIFEDRVTLTSPYLLDWDDRYDWTDPLVPVADMPFEDRLVTAFDGPVVGLYFFGPYMITKVGTKLYDNFAEIPGVSLPSDSYLSCVDFSKILYIAATPSVKKYIRTAGLSNWGIDAPDDTPTLADLGVAGNVNGSYYYKYTFLSAQGKESIASPMSAVIIVVSSQVRISGLEAPSDSQVVSKNIYRFGGTSALFKLVGTVDAADGFFDDNIVDASLGVEYDADKHYAPSNIALKFAALHFGRIYGLSDAIGQENWLWFSEAFEPEYMGRDTLENYLLVGGSEKLVALLPMYRTMLAFKENEIYVCEGTIPSEMFITPTPAKHGCAAPFSPAMYKQPIFASWDGIYTFDGRTEEKLVDYTDPIFESGLKKAYIDRCPGIVWRGLYFFSYPSNDAVYTSTGYYPDKTLVIDLEHANHVYHYDGGFTQFAIDNRGNLWAGDSDGFVYKLEQTSNTDAESIYVCYKSKKFALGNQPGEVGGIRELLFTAKTGSDPQ